MSLGDWGAADGSQRVATVALTALSAPTSANTKGAWTQLVATAPFDVAAIMIATSITTSNTSGLVDIGIGASGSEQVLVPSWPVKRVASSQTGHSPVLLPVPVSAGTRIAARFQLATLGAPVSVGLVMLAAAWNTQPSCGRVAAYGASLATSSGTVVDPGASAGSKGAWVEIASATDFDSTWLALSVLPVSTAAGAGTQFYVDVGIGPAGAEQALVPDLPMICAGATDTTTWRAALPAAIPAGSRLAVRVQSSTATTPGREREIVAHLIG